MKEIFLGEVIRQRRLELGLTQEELCEGICEPITISRLENGKQTPSRNRIKAILQRLGLPDDRFYSLLTDKELQISTIEEQIDSCHARFEQSDAEKQNTIREKVYEKHRELEQIAGKDDAQMKQLILRSRWLLGKEKGPYSLDEGLQMLLEAIRLTSPNFDIAQIGQGLYTKDEIILIIDIAQCYLGAGRHYDAIDVLKQLLCYLQTRAEKIPLIRNYIPLVAYNYAKELEKVKQLEESIEIAEYARRVCIDYSQYQNLPDILAILAKCYHYQENNKKSEELYYQSYYLYKVVGNEKCRKLIQQEAKTLLGIDLG